jgi:uncharacterized membrane protein
MSIIIIIMKFVVVVVVVIIYYHWCEQPVQHPSGTKKYDIIKQ